MATRRRRFSGLGKSWWDSVAGPFMTELDVCGWLAISQGELDALVQANRVISLPTSDGEDIFPTPQFDSDRTPLPRLDELWPILTAVYTRWETAAWTSEQISELGGQNTFEVLRAGNEGDIEAVLAGARQDVARLRH